MMASTSYVLAAYNPKARQSRTSRHPTALRPPGIITPEMEFIAIRENMGRERNVAKFYATSIRE